MRNRTASHFLFSSNLSGVSDDDLWLPPVARNRSRDTDFLAAVGFLWWRRKLASVLSPYERCEYLVRIWTIQVQESRTASAPSRERGTCDLPAHYRWLANVL